MQKTAEDYVVEIEQHLAAALFLAQSMQNHVVIGEGDSDLNRKLTHYLVPNLNHWITGAQAGNIKDLKETLDRRKQKCSTGKVDYFSTTTGECEVLTDPIK